MIMNTEAHKLIAIEKICNAAGIKLKNAVAFGDDLNDIDMLNRCCCIKCP